MWIGHLGYIWFQFGETLSCILILPWDFGCVNPGTSIWKFSSRIWYRTVILTVVGLVAIAVALISVCIYLVWELNITLYIHDITAIVAVVGLICNSLFSFLKIFIKFFLNVKRDWVFWLSIILKKLKGEWLKKAQGFERSSPPRLTSSEGCKFFYVSGCDGRWIFLHLGI